MDDEDDKSRGSRGSLDVTEEKNDSSRGSRRELGEDPPFSEPIQPLRDEVDTHAKTYPIDSLQSLSDIAKDLIDHVQCPPGMAAQCTLACVSLAAQNYANVLHPFTGGAIPVSEYFLTPAESGERKTTCDSLMLKPHKIIEQARMEQYYLDLKQYKYTLKDWERNRMPGSTEEPPKEPDNPMFIMTDPTTEAIEKHDAISVGVFANEGGRFTGGHGWSPENVRKTLAFYNQAWDGQEIRRNRAGDGHSLKVDPRLAMHIMMQPNVARGFVDNKDFMEIGFLPRCLMCYPTTTIGTREIRLSTKFQDKNSYQRYAQRITELLNYARVRKLIPLEPAAIQELRIFAQCIEDQQAEGKPLANARAFASRIVEHVLRLAGIITVYERGKGVSMETIMNCIDLGEFYLDETLRMLGDMVELPNIQAAISLQKWLATRLENGYSLHDLRTIVRTGPNSLRTQRTLLKEAITLLVKHKVLSSRQNISFDGAVRKQVWRTNATLPTI